MNSNLSISDFIEVVKSNSEVKKLVADAIVGNKSFASDSLSNSHATLSSGRFSSSWP